MPAVLYTWGNIIERDTNRNRDRDKPVDRMRQCRGGGEETALRSNLQYRGKENTQTTRRQSLATGWYRKLWQSEHAASEFSEDS